MYILVEACSDASFAATILFIKKLVDIIFIIAPILLILLITIDFTKAVMANDDNRIRELKDTAIKRVLFAVLLFFVPLILDAAFSLLDNDKGNVISCYNKVDNSYVNNLAEKLEAETKEQEAQREKTVSDIKAKQKTNADKRKNYAASAATKIVDNNQTAKLTTNLSPSSFVGQATIGSAGGKGIHKSKWTSRKNSGPWIAVVRAKDPNKRLLIANSMTQAIKLKQVKYSQNKTKRQTFYKEAQKVNFNLPKVTKVCYTSCSSVASVILRAAGFSSDVAPSLVYSDSLSSKTNLRKRLSKRTDLFTVYTSSDYTASSSKLQAGDILFSKHHTAIVIKAKNKVS